MRVLRLKPRTEMPLYRSPGCWVSPETFRLALKPQAVWSGDQKWLLLVPARSLPLPCSAISISRRPNSACLMFFTQKLLLPLELVCCLSRGETSSSELSV